MFSNLQTLKEKGYTPSTIFDIGAHQGSWTDECMKVYKDSEYHLFEAIEYSELDRFRELQNVHIGKGVILNETVTEVDWFEMRNTGDSMFREKTRYFNNPTVIRRPTTTLDIVLKDSEITGSVFIKIDCQGAEIPILKGATKLLEATDFVLLEIPFFGQYNAGVPTFLEHIQFMDSIGFIPYDILEHHVMKGFLMQVDILFIRKTHSLNKTVQDDMFVW
uniref:Methyltransferase FkbM domain-containing protein n=1 Tax=viral metagenome TaxID=1070528 RepID=A0A6C0HJU8_9ZZZZ